MIFPQLLLAKPRLKDESNPTHDGNRTLITLLVILLLLLAFPIALMLHILLRIDPVNEAVTTTVTSSSSAPVFSSGTEINVSENLSTTSAVYRALASNLTADTFTYSLRGEDAEWFGIEANTGILTFNRAPDYESPMDADANNVYIVTVTASGVAKSASQQVSITVTNENDNVPVFL